MRDYIKQSAGWSALCHALLLVAIGLSALCAASCRTHKSVERTTIRADTLIMDHTEYEILTTETESIAGDTVSVKIPIDLIQNLPDGAMFSKKQGRTRVNLIRAGDAVVAEAESDSIERVLKHYERKARDSLQRGNSSVDCETSERKQYGVNPIMWVVVIVMLSVMGAMAVGKRH